MKANYKIVANKQKMLEKEIENFEPTSTMSVLLMRYSIIQGLLQVKPNEKDENGIPNISPVDMAYEMTTFLATPSMLRLMISQMMMRTTAQ